MKKIIALLLAVLFCMTFAACSDDSDNVKRRESTDAAVTATEDVAATQATDAVPTEEPSEDDGMTVADYLETEEGVLY